MPKADKNISLMGALPDIRSLTHDELESYLYSKGLPAFRLKQLEEWLWSKHVSSFCDMLNLPKTLRESLASSFSLAHPLELTKQISSDGSRKYLLEFSDGVRVECVGMPTSERLSVCVSSQAGCAMSCAFCATGLSGLTRSLKAHEIYDQLFHVANDFNMRPSSVVFMGQGEPFANYEQTLRALRLLNNPSYMGIGSRHLTVSTCGIIPYIARFANEPEQFTLAISLHSAVQETRNHLMPGVKKYSLAHLHAVLVDYTNKTGRRPTYEYLLIAGVNDSDSELQALCDFCEGTLAHVNLIQLNEVKDSPFRPSSSERAQVFVRRLAAVGVEATIRKSRGADIDAACGQLKQQFGFKRN